jgi:dicarboxylate transporter 10
MNGLWKPGVGAQAWGMGLSSGIRFACYEPFRNALVGEHGEKSHGHMVLAGLSAGCIGYIITTPFHLLKTTMQAQLESPQRRPYVHDFMTGMQQIVQKQGFASLYRGAIPLSSRGALFTAGQLVGYDGCKTMARDAGYKDNAYLHVASAVSASFWASFLSAPADLVMAKYMSSQNSLSSSIREIYIQHGVVGFWRGWTVFLVRLTPSLLTYSTLYEQLRHNLGLGYFE